MVGADLPKQVVLEKPHLLLQGLEGGLALGTWGAMGGYAGSPWAPFPTAFPHGSCCRAGGEGCWWLMTGGLWGAQQCPAAAGAAAQLGRSLCGWEVTSGGPFLCLGQRVAAPRRVIQPIPGY